MSVNHKFGSNLRELRKRAGLTLRELADKVDVNFTYLSKIENGALPPPSEKVIRKLADVLNVDKDELLTMAGIIPSDIAEILKDRKTREHLRAEQAKMKGKEIAVSQKQETVQQSEVLEKPTKANVIPKKFVRVVAAASLAILVGVLLWFAMPITESAIAANNQGVVYNNSGEYDKAIEAFNKAIELDPTLAIAYNNRGWSYLELGENEHAIVDCTKAIELDPSLALAYSNRGLAYVRLVQYEQAIADCTKAIELDPGLALAYSNRGQAYINLGKYEEAIADLDKAVELDPSLQK